MVRNIYGYQIFPMGFPQQMNGMQGIGQTPSMFNNPLNGLLGSSLGSGLGSGLGASSMFGGGMGSSGLLELVLALAVTFKDMPDSPTEPTTDESRPEGTTQATQENVDNYKRKSDEFVSSTLGFGDPEATIGKIGLEARKMLNSYFMVKTPDVRNSLNQTENEKKLIDKFNEIFIDKLKDNGYDSLEQAVERLGKGSDALAELVKKAGNEAYQAAQEWRDSAGL